jgi:alkylhydroperoxidase family enzyme
VLRDWRTAPVDERVRAALAMLEAMTLRPDEIGPDDVAPLLATGVSPAAVADALYVGFCFNTIDRMADSLGFPGVSPKEYGKSADRLLKRGYL